MKIEEATRREWFDVADACEYATFFHTPLWADVVTQTYEDWNDYTTKVEFNNGTTAVLPVVGHRHKTEKMGISIEYNTSASSWASCFGGFIADGPLPDNWGDAVIKVFKSLPRTYRINVTGNPIAPLDSFPPNSQVELDDDFTQLIQLNKFDSFEDVFYSFQSDVRQNTRRAKDEGLNTRVAEGTDDWENYYGAYQASLERWGDSATNNYDWPLFETLCEMAEQHSQHIQLWLVEVDGELASGELTFYWNDHTVCWHAASYDEHLSKSPNDFLHAEKIEDAMDRDFSFYDFNPSGGHEGVVDYKSKFAEKVPIQRLTWTNPRMDRVRKLKDALTR